MTAVFEEINGALVAVADNGRAWLDPASSWSYVDLDPILEGRQVEEPPSILARTDGQALFYPGRVHVLAGEPEAGKGWLVCRAAADELNADHHVVYIDFEDTAAAIVGRLQALGASADRILEFLHYVRSDGRSKLMRGRC